MDVRFSFIANSPVFIENNFIGKDSLVRVYKSMGGFEKQNEGRNLYDNLFFTVTSTKEIQSGINSFILDRGNIVEIVKKNRNIIKENTVTVKRRQNMSSEITENEIIVIEEPVLVGCHILEVGDIVEILPVKKSAIKEHNRNSQYILTEKLPLPNRKSLDAGSRIKVKKKKQEAKKPKLAYRPLLKKGWV